MSGFHYEGSDLTVLGEMPNYYSWIMKYFSAHLGGEIIEYGAGSGTMSRRILPFAKRLTLVEPSPNLARQLDIAFSEAASVTVVCDLLERHVRTLEDESTNTIVLVNVLEHVENDKAALSELVRSLKPGGHLLLFVPALPSLFSKIDLIHGHFRRYTQTELTQKVMSAGAEPILCRYFDFVGIFPWLVLNKLLGSTTFSPALVQFNDRIIVPLSRAAESMLAPPIGKNLILTATKRKA